MASKIKILTDLIRGTGHFVQDGLGDYHAALLVRNANMRVGTARRATAMKKALKGHAVMVSYHADDINGPIRLYVPSKKTELILNA